MIKKGFNHYKLSSQPKQDFNLPGIVKGQSIKMSNRIINQDLKNSPSWKPYVMKKPANYRKQSMQTSASKEDTKKQTEHSYLSESQTQKKQMSSNKKINKYIKQQQKNENTNYKIQYYQSNVIPQPQAINRQSMRYYKYYINQLESKVYFYPFASKIYWNYVQLKQQPKFDDDQYQGFIKEMEVACQYYSDPIFVVNLQTAIIHLQKLKKQRKYEGKIDWKAYEKEMAKMDEEYRKNYVIPRYQDIIKN